MFNIFIIFFNKKIYLHDFVNKVKVILMFLIVITLGFLWYYYI